MREPSNVKRLGSGLFIVLLVIGCLFGVGAYYLRRSKVFELERTIDVPRGFPPLKLSFAQDGRTLLLGPDLSACSPFLFDTSSGYQVRTISESRLSGGVTLSPDATLLAGMGRGFVTNVVKVDTGKVEKSFEMTPASRAGLAWSPDGRWLACGTDERSVKIGDCSSGRVARTLEVPGSNGSIRAVSFDPSGRLLASGCSDGAIQVWSVDTWATIVVLELPVRSGPGREEVSSLAFSRDGSLLAGGGGSGSSAGSGSTMSGVMQIWSTRDWKLAQRIDLPAPADSLSFSADGRQLACSSWSQVQVWDLPSRSQVWFHATATSGMYPSVCFGGEGLLAFVDAHGPIQVWRRVR
jgi:WD40 repeat protein